MTGLHWESVKMSVQHGGSWGFCPFLLRQGEFGLWEAQAAAEAEDGRQVLQFKSTGQTQSSSLISFTLLKIYRGKALLLKQRAVSQSQRSLARAEHQKAANTCREKAIFEKPMHKFKGK